ncbi:MAG TPA: family 43 glycosylhydrolase [Marinagarivorans sp.]
MKVISFHSGWPHAKWAAVWLAVLSLGTLSGCVGSTDQEPGAVSSASLGNSSSSVVVSSSFSSAPASSSSLDQVSSVSSSISSAASQPDAKIDRGVYTLTSRVGGKLLEVEAASNADGANVIQWRDLGGPNQRWIIREVINNYYSIVNVQSGKALEVYELSTADGANVAQYDYWQGDSQLWRIIDVGDGYVQLINRLSEKALTVAGASTADGANIEQLAASNNDNQAWQLNFLGSVDGPVEDKSETNGAENHWPISGDTFSHDPTMYEEDGVWYQYFTADWIGSKRSNDGRNWRDTGPVLAGEFDWWRDYVPAWEPANVWAPEIDRYGDRVWMWYSVSTFGSRVSAIGLMSATSAAIGDWRDEGVAISSDNSNNYNAIDADLAVDEYGDPWMTFGSWNSGIKITRLNPLTMKPVGPLYSVAAKGGGIEAPDVIYRQGYYYLFVSLGKCCDGVNSTYHIVYGRAEKITGPYLDKNGVDMMNGGGTVLDAGNDVWIGPGGQDIVNTHIIIRHAYPTSENPWAAMLISTLNWDSEGWPRY